MDEQPDHAGHESHREPAVVGIVELAQRAPVLVRQIDHSSQRNAASPTTPVSTGVRAYWRIHEAEAGDAVAEAAAGSASPRAPAGS